jgi:hypothetical protein
MNRIFALWLLVLGGLVAASAINRLLLRFVRPKRSTPRTATIDVAELIAGVGAAGAVLFPHPFARLVAFMAGIAGIVVASLLRLSGMRPEGPTVGGPA